MLLFAEDHFFSVYFLGYTTYLKNAVKNWQVWKHDYIQVSVSKQKHFFAKKITHMCLQSKLCYDEHGWPRLVLL